MWLISDYLPFIVSRKYSFVFSCNKQLCSSLCRSIHTFYALGGWKLVRRPIVCEVVCVCVLQMLFSSCVNLHYRRLITSIWHLNVDLHTVIRCDFKVFNDWRGSALNRFNTCIFPLFACFSYHVDSTCFIVLHSIIYCPTTTVTTTNVIIIITFWSKQF